MLTAGENAPYSNDMFVRFEVLPEQYKVPREI